jgi:LacI family transcriptional regulator
LGQGPIVLVDRLVEGAEIDAVLSDNEGGAWELTRRLIADGFKRIAFVGGDRAISTARERIAGFSRALREAKLSPESGMGYTGGMEVEDGYRRMGRILESSGPPEALVAVNLLVHLGMERRLLEDRRGRGGGKFSPVIAAFDETAYTPFLPACRYTAAQDAAAMGKEAARRILDRIGRMREPGKSPEDPRQELRGEGAGGRIIRLPVRIVGHWGAA